MGHPSPPSAIARLRDLVLNDAPDTKTQVLKALERLEEAETVLRNLIIGIEWTSDSNSIYADMAYDEALAKARAFLAAPQEGVAAKEEG